MFRAGHARAAVGVHGILQTEKMAPHYILECVLKWYGMTFYENVANVSSIFDFNVPLNKINNSELRLGPILPYNPPTRSRVYYSVLLTF